MRNKITNLIISLTAFFVNHLTKRQKILTSFFLIGFLNILTPYESMGASIETLKQEALADQWKRNSSNPLIVPDPAHWTMRGSVSVNAADPCILYDEESKRYKMWFGTGGPGHSSGLPFIWTMYAESVDGDHWDVQSQPAFESSSDENSWDYTHRETPSVVINPNAPAERRYVLFYSGGNYIKGLINNIFPYYNIGVAFSKDGKHFTPLPSNESPYKQEGLALKAQDAFPNIKMDWGIISDPMAVYKDGMIHVWFSSLAFKGNNAVVNGIGYAKTKDGIHWEPHGQTVIPQIATPAVLWNPSEKQYHLWASIEEKEKEQLLPEKGIIDQIIFFRHQHFISQDGIRWERKPKLDIIYHPDLQEEMCGLSPGPSIILKNENGASVYEAYYAAWGRKNVPQGWGVSCVWAINKATLSSGSKDIAEPSSQSSSQVKMTLPSTRAFFMGFVPAEYDVGQPALEEVYQFIEKNADLITHHFVGVPWVEAFEKKPYHPNVENQLKLREQKLNNKQKVFLYMSPLAVKGDQLGPYSGESDSMERPGRWKNKRIDDPEVLTAYTNFCKDLIKRLKPTFMGYAIEVNNMVNSNPKEWPQFLKLAEYVYKEIKKENLQLPVFVSFSLDTWGQDDNLRKAIKDMLPYTDIIGISSYPYISGYGDPQKIPKDYFSRVLEWASGKPIAFAETGFIAKDFQAFNIKEKGTPEFQNVYLNLLFNESQKLNAKFINWFIPRDYDRFFKVVESLNPGPDIVDLFKVWKNTGLLDEEGKPRPSLDTWNVWHKIPYK